MIPWVTRARRTVLSSLFHTRAHRMLARRARGMGAIFTLHHVRPEKPGTGFAPNRILEITPGFLEETIQRVKRLGYRIFSLDESVRRLAEGDSGQPFVSFTLDDGYEDNFTHAFPVFREHGIPFTIYLCPGLLTGTIRQWWRDLEAIVAGHDHLEMELDGTHRDFDCEDPRGKHRTFEAIYWTLRRLPHEVQVRLMDDLVARYPPPEASTPRMLTRSMIREMYASGLLTAGAHTMTHPALSKLDRPVVLQEMEESRDWLASWSGEPPRHFSYPYGDAGSAARREFDAARTLGFDTGVTTRKGVLFPEHRDFLYALPRISLNGDYQRPDYVEVFLSGAPFLIDPGLRRIDVV